MPGLSDDIEFSALSDEELLKLLEEEREKRKSFAPPRLKSVAKGAQGPKKPRAPKGEIVEIDLD